MKKNDFFLVTKKEGIKYSLLSRDNNKIHVDPSYGYNSLFGQNICHGTFIILNFLKKIKFHDKQNFYMDISFRYPFFYNHKIFIKKKNKSQTQYSLLQGKKEKALISLDFSNETIDSIKKIKGKKTYLKKIRKKKKEIEAVLNTLSMYVGTIYPGEKSLISNIKILHKNENNDEKKNVISISSKVLKKGFPIIDNYLKFNSYNVNFESLIRPDVIQRNRVLPNYLNKILNKVNHNVLIIGGSQGIGKQFLDILKKNKKIIKIATYNKNIIKTKTRKIVIKKLDVFKNKKVLDQLIRKYSPLRIYYFPTEKIYFDNKLSKKISDNYKKIFIQIPLEILKKHRDQKIQFFYPSTTNIELNKNSIYSKVKIEAEKKIKEICNKYKIKHFIYRFPAILSRQSISMTNPNPPDLIQHINMNKKITKILF